jgi:hypothetical protein
MEMRVSQQIIESIEFLKRKYYWAVGSADRIYSADEAVSRNSMELTMGWATLYITGKGDFREAVREKLEESDLHVMPGYTGMVAAEEVHDLYWVDEKIQLRQFKEAIGSKLIWNYRLRFYPSFEAFIESQNKEKSKRIELTPEDLALIEEMKSATK